MYFSILIYDEPDSAKLRDQYRKVHLEYLKQFDDQTLFAGPITSDDESADLGSLRLIEFPDRAAASKHVDDEPYVTGGVQKRWRLHRWLPRGEHIWTWRDCPRKQGNIQALFHGLDQPNGMALRKENRDAHEEYLVLHADKILARGPLVEDHGEKSVGTVILLEIPHMDAAREFLSDEPFYKAGVYAEPNLYRWRFGRVMDRFKE